MFVAICGFIGIILGVTSDNNTLTIIGAGAIGLDLVLELSNINSNIRILVDNLNVYIRNQIERRTRNE